MDVHSDPRRPGIVKVIEPEEIVKKTGYTRRTPCIACRAGS